MKTLPEQLAMYKRTHSFDKQSVPKALLVEHRTTPGTWGRLVVESGRVSYFIIEPGAEEEVLLAPGSSGIIEPNVGHYIQPDETAKFHIEFYR